MSGICAKNVNPPKKLAGLVWQILYAVAQRLNMEYLSLIDYVTQYVQNTKTTN